MINHSEPETSDTDREDESYSRRKKAGKYSKSYAQPSIPSSSDEVEYANERFPHNFTKALKHNRYGMLETPTHYETLVNLINQNFSTDFNSIPPGLSGGNAKTNRVDNDTISWRGWESPRTGHFYSLQGADSDKVGMDPPPALGEEELMVEMAEVYALALLRDIPLKAFTDPTGVATGQLLCSNTTVQQVIDALLDLEWYQGVASTSPLRRQARRRRAARKHQDGMNALDINNPADEIAFDASLLFRGSSPGCKTGPYVSQFLVNGYPVTTDSTGLHRFSEIRYGAQVIDQQIRTMPPHEDYMVYWYSYLDVQNGANFSDVSGAAFDKPDAAGQGRPRRFIATPRDLASYVKIDALYQAYLNACLLMLSRSGSDHFQFQQPVPNGAGIAGPGFPDKNPTDPRQGFASFGGPHILSLVTEVATRCLKAVRRQKYNFHRRARPERLGGLLTLHAHTTDSNGGNGLGTSTRVALDEMVGNSPTPNSIGAILDLIKQFNQNLLEETSQCEADPHLIKPGNPAWIGEDNHEDICLLPMAYAEGSPLHPSYGAGHATVAGGCVTILKAFFDTVENSDNRHEPKLWPSTVDLFEADVSGLHLNMLDRNDMTIAGELNKLAANISIARNMGGVHFYSDYYDSARMGERIAMSILLEQMFHYDEPIEFDFHSFDGDYIHIIRSDQGSTDPSIAILRPDQNGMMVPESFEDWWLRHVQDGGFTSSLFANNTDNGADAVATVAAEEELVTFTMRREDMQRFKDLLDIMETTEDG